MNKQGIWVGGLQVETTNHHVALTSSEIGNLWTQYMNDSLASCILRHSVEHATDEDLKQILHHAINLSESHLEKIKIFLTKEKFPIPKGFTIEDDVNISAPPLFSDTFLLVYMHVMTLHGLTGYAAALGTSCRKDQITYFMECNKETMNLYDKIIEVMLNKGIYNRTPHLNPPKEIDYVKKQSYLAGWFGKVRPLSAMEISGLAFNMQKTAAKIVLELGFGQVCQSKEVQKYFKRGKEVCKKQFGIFSAILTNEELRSPTSWINEVTDTTVSPFSDKLMLFHIVNLLTSSIWFLGGGFAISQRRDLALDYLELITEAGLLAEDGAQLLINKGWLEQPPLNTNREELAKHKS